MRLQIPGHTGYNNVISIIRISAQLTLVYIIRCVRLETLIIRLYCILCQLREKWDKNKKINSYYRVFVQVPTFINIVCTARKKKICKLFILYTIANNKSSIRTKIWSIRKLRLYYKRTLINVFGFRSETTIVYVPSKLYSINRRIM